MDSLPQMVSPRKSTSALSLIPEERCKMAPRCSTKSCESLYSNTSSSRGSAIVNYRRKNIPVMGGAAGNKGGGRIASIIPATTEVRQRVLSARRLRMKTYQNQLADAQQTIADLAHENRILRTLHKRQDSALAKYESTNAELPQLLHSHAEELRMWQTKYRNLQTVNKDMEQKLKQKESVILSLGDQNKYYSQLNKDKNLDERQRLSEKVQMLEQRIQEKDNDMKLLARRVQIETKNFKQQLLNEQKRTKNMTLKLEKTRLELSSYRKLDELNLPVKYSGIALRRKANQIEETDATRLESDLQKILDGETDGGGDGDSATVDETINITQASQRSLRKGTIVSKLEMSSTRTIRKRTDHMNGEQKQQQNQQNSLTITQRRLDRGDGDAAAMCNLKKSAPNKQQQEKPLQKFELTNKPTSLEYEDEYENDEETTAIAAEDDEVDNNGGEGEEEEDEYEDEEEEEEEIYDEDAAQQDELTEEKDEQEDIIHTAKTTKMKEDMSSIRRQISSDYKEREAFLDTFCRQATSGALSDVITPKKRNSIAMGQGIPSNRKHKLLAALKAIDDNKSQD